MAECLCMYVDTHLCGKWPASVCQALHPMNAFPPSRSFFPFPPFPSPLSSSQDLPLRGRTLDEMLMKGRQEEARGRKPGVVPSHTQAGRGRGISTSPTHFFGGGGCSVWWWWWLWSGQARVWCGCINAAGTHEHRQGLPSISLSAWATQLQRQEQGQAPLWRASAGGRKKQAGPPQAASPHALP